MRQTRLRDRVLFILLAIFCILAASLNAGEKPKKQETYFAYFTPRITVEPANGTLYFGVNTETEENYCVSWEITWPNGTRKTQEQDCMPWADYKKAEAAYDECTERVVVVPPGFTASYNCEEPQRPDRKWNVQLRGVPAGEYKTDVRFYIGRKQLALREALWTVAGM